MTYYIYKTGGPYTLGQLRSMWASGAITSNMLARKDGTQDWFLLSTMAADLEVPATAAHVTTEATGKRWKAIQLKATVWVTVTLSLLIASIIAGYPVVGACLFAMMLAGIGVYYWAKAKAWWHHG